jgi:trimethylamine--corrinoid protein Co-methyltransferase
MWSTVGSDAHCLDEQAAMEHAFGTLLAAMDGANLIHDIGYLGQGLLGNPAAIVMCDEIISYVKRIIRGFDLSREMMAVDVIRSVGPGGNFLTVKHTQTHFRQELWQPNFLNRDSPETWARRLRFSRRIGQSRCPRMCISGSMGSPAGRRGRWRTYSSWPNTTTSVSRSVILSDRRSLS